MKVGIIGSAEVGQSLAKGFKAEGHEVILGTRDVHKKEVTEFTKVAGIQAGTFDKVAAFGEIIVLAVPGAAVEEAAKLAGIKNFSGKIVIDATNPIHKAQPVNGVLKFFTTLEDSLMERIQKLLPEAKLVKAFNSVGNTLMYKPSLPGGRPTMFICGNDEGAKKTVTDILTSFGWDTEDMGKAEAARAIEPLCILWCIPGFLHNQWSHAFKLLKP